MEEHGAEQVGVTVLDDKWEIIGVVSTTLFDHLFPPQVIYAGKTDRCHLKVTFTENWDIEKLSENIRCAFVPVSGTGELQPHNLVVSKVFKATVRDLLRAWYAEQVQMTLDSYPGGLTKAGLWVSVMKPILAMWFIEVFKLLGGHQGDIIASFMQTGIVGT